MKTGEEGYQSISGRDVTTAADDLILCDNSRVISSILKGPDYDTRITSDTRDVLFTIYAPPGIGTHEVRTALMKLEERIRAFAPDSKTEMLEVL